MSRITFNLPNDNTVVINDANNNGFLDQGEAVYVNGNPLNPHTCSQGSQAYEYLLRILGVTDLSQVRNLPIARQVYDTRWSTLEAGAAGNCERFGELVRGVNTLAADHGMRTFAYSDFSSLATGLPDYPDGRLANLLTGVVNLMLCESLPLRGGTSLGSAMRFHFHQQESITQGRITPAMMRELRQQIPPGVGSRDPSRR